MILFIIILWGAMGAVLHMRIQSGTGA